jgi:hypothetical protein
VESEPPELVVLLADQDTRRFVEAVIERGLKRRCLPPVRIEYVIDPMKDSSVVRRADALLRACVRRPWPRVVVIWDHHGSGRQRESSTAVEADVLALVERTGFPRDHILTLAVDPELEALLGPVWETVLDALRDIGSQPRPEVAFSALDPKASLEMAAVKARVKLAPHIFSQLGGRVSIPALKQSEIGGRLSGQSETWFPRLPAG